MTRSIVSLACSGVALTVLAGCMPKMTIEQMKEMMPERPAELDQLDAFVGKWQGSGEAHIGGLEDTLKSEGTMDIHWAGDGWYLVTDSVDEMDEFGKMVGKGLWSWDDQHNRFHTYWVDSMGSTYTGWAKYNKNDNEWHMYAKGRSAMGESTGRGTMRFIDNDTMEWHWKETAGLMTVFEGHGTSTRQ